MLNGPADVGAQNFLRMRSVNVLVEHAFSLPAISSKTGSGFTLWQQ